MKTKVLTLMTLAICVMGSQSWALDTVQSDVPAILDGIQACTLSDSTMDSVRGEKLYTFVVKLTATHEQAGPYLVYYWLGGATVTVSQTGKTPVSKSIPVTKVTKSSGTYIIGMNGEQKIQYDVPDDSYVKVDVKANVKITDAITYRIFQAKGQKITSVYAKPFLWVYRTINVPVSMTLYRY